MQGPRPLQWDEIDALGEMYGRTIHRAALGIFMPHNPNLFNRGNLDNMLILRDRERICSHVGLNPFRITSMGCTFSSGCIGGVHTHEDYRKRGLATQILLHLFDRCRNRGDHFLAISGRRGLYHRNHAMLVGTAYRFVLSPEQAEALSCQGIEVRDFEDIQIAELARIHALEPVRVIRPKTVWEFFVLTRSCHFAPSKTFVAWRNNMPIAYLIVREENRNNVTEVLEFAGDRTAVCASLAHILRQQSGERIMLAVMQWDSPLIGHIEASGVEAQAEATSGAVRVIDFGQTVNAYRPRLAERIGSDAAHALSVQAGAEEVAFGLNRDRLSLDVDSATKLFFGVPPGEKELDLGTSDLAAALREGFPIPLPSYGMDYV